MTTKTTEGETMETKTAIESWHTHTPEYSLATGSCDFGLARLEDGTVWLITWGRNLTPEQVQFHQDKTTYEPIEIDEGVFELIIYRVS